MQSDFEPNFTILFVDVTLKAIIHTTGVMKSPTNSLNSQQSKTIIVTVVFTLALQQQRWNSIDKIHPEKEN